jgi:hypothetical protein
MHSPERLIFTSNHGQLLGKQERSSGRCRHREYLVRLQGSDGENVLTYVSVVRLN